MGKGAIYIIFGISMVLILFWAAQTAFGNIRRRKELERQETLEKMARDAAQADEPQEVPGGQETEN